MNLSITGPDFLVAHKMDDRIDTAGQESSVVKPSGEISFEDLIVPRYIAEDFFGRGNKIRKIIKQQNTVPGHKVEGEKGCNHNDTKLSATPTLPFLYDKLLRSG